MDTQITAFYQQSFSFFSLLLRSLKHMNAIYPVVSKTVLYALIETRTLPFLLSVGGWCYQTVGTL